VGKTHPPDLDSALSDLPNWETLPDREVAAWLRAQKIKNARGVWFDARGVADMRRARAMAAKRRQAAAARDREAAERRFAEYAEGIRKRLLALLSELQCQHLSRDRLTELESEHGYIFLSLLAQEKPLDVGVKVGWAHYPGYDTLWKGTHMAEWKIESHKRRASPACEAI
jgi:hypothetical protein